MFLCFDLFNCDEAQSRLLSATFAFARRLCAPGGGDESSESVSLSLLSSTWKLGKFHDMLTMPSDSCKRMWASMRPWQSITITCPSAVPNSTCRGQEVREDVVREDKAAWRPSHDTFNLRHRISTVNSEVLLTRVFVAIKRAQRKKFLYDLIFLHSIKKTWLRPNQYNVYAKYSF